MSTKSQTLHVSAEDLAVIEAALHTQSKILHVQANAGGEEASSRLNSVKRTLATVAQQKPSSETTSRCAAGGWFGMSRMFG